ncbi:MAG: nitroreductase [Sphingomonadales bacterium]|nr:nitroreductase [Sphingomonadales bacterium]
MNTLELLMTRRSVKAAMLTTPGPTAADLDNILMCASRVPDHKKLVPWRFIVFEGEARQAFGDVLARTLQAEDKEQPSPARLDIERGRLMRAPTVVCVVSRVVPSPGAPEWEPDPVVRRSSANLCLAANAMGFGTCWITEWYAYSPGVRAALTLADNERIAGFVFIGTAKERQADRERPALSDIVSHWHA